ncbi:hypothetical protein QR680_011948 [Steinernema hermaphroditum]|uniref:G-protein coupled receptors family 1 profile domain-containing protein n=1 Tax=Steinernema hermaphroditum TaxID=289476 RepID=A0AA39I1W6_9BILA|nr:hypothetical protein QR680_011948 [Steinernema hermaphroditum]
MSGPRHLVIDMEYNFSTTVYLVPTYYHNAFTVVCSIIPSLLPNIFILAIGLSSMVIRDKFRDSIIMMTIGNLFSSIVPLSFHLLYFYFYYAKAPMNFLLCSFLRRFVAFSYTPMLYGSCLVAVDRFYGVCLNRMFSRRKLILLSMILWFYPFLMFLSQMTSSRVRYEDICGPTKGAHFTWMLDINTGLFIAYPILAFGLNATILVYLYRNSKKLVIAGRKLNSTDAKKERHVVYGMLCQSIIPLICQLPMLICIMLYYREVSLPAWIWTVSNVVYHLNLTLNPIFTVIFVKQFRHAVCTLLSSNRVSVFAQSSSAHSRTP